MYAIIRAGGKQAKVQSGDVIEIERVKGDAEELSFAPLLVVDDKGNAVSDRDVLAKALVTAKVLGESQGPEDRHLQVQEQDGLSASPGSPPEVHPDRDHRHQAPRGQSKVRREVF